MSSAVLNPLFFLPFPTCPHSMYFPLYLWEVLLNACIIFEFSYSATQLILINNIDSLFFLPLLFPPFFLHIFGQVKTRVFIPFADIAAMPAVEQRRRFFGISYWIMQGLFSNLVFLDSFLASKVSFAQFYPYNNLFPPISYIFSHADGYYYTSGLLRRWRGQHFSRSK